MQRPLGLVARLLPPPREGRLQPAAAQVLSASFDPEERQFLTGTGTAAVRWDLARGRLLEEIPPAHRRDGDDGNVQGVAVAVLALLLLTVQWIGRVARTAAGRGR